MKFSTSGACLLLAAASATTTSAAPNQWILDQSAFAGLPPSTTLTSQVASHIASILSPLTSIWQPDVSADLTTHDHSDKSIYDVITTNEHFTQLAKAVGYSSDATKDLLKGKNGEKLTIFAPVNVHRKRHDDKHLQALTTAGDSHGAAALVQSTSAWSVVEKRIAEYEATVANASDDDDDDDKERRRRRLARFIDAVLSYHLVDTKEPVLSSQLIDNSTVATKLSINGKAAEYVGKLNDGQPLRIRVGKSLVPRPGVYLNFYSRVLYPDVQLSNGVLHAVQYPLFQFPSILQGLFSGQPEFSTLTTAYLKRDAEGYLALPEPKHHGKRVDDEHHDLPHNGRQGLSDPKGSPAATLFAPSNIAWDALPWSFRAYLFSPWGGKLLGKILMLHSIPHDIVYADSVHHVSEDGGQKETQGVTVTYDEPNIIAKLWGRDHPRDHYPPPNSHAKVTRYTVNSVLPKLPEDGKPDDDLPPPDEAKEFEQVDVEVWRYYLLPGNKGPLQTAVKVQGNWVAIHDIVNVNGATHLLNHFVKPKDHPHQGVWADVAREAEAHGFGSVDLEEEVRSQRW